MPERDKIAAVVEAISATDSLNKRVALIRKIPEEFGKAQHQAVYAAIAKAIYVSELAPDFAYIHWRDEYELAPITQAYNKAFALTNGFKKVDVDTLDLHVASPNERSDIRDNLFSPLPDVASLIRDRPHAFKSAPRATAKRFALLAARSYIVYMTTMVIYEVSCARFN